MPADFEADMMSIVRSFRNVAAVAASRPRLFPAARLRGRQAAGDVDSRSRRRQKPVAEKPRRRGRESLLRQRRARRSRRRASPGRPSASTELDAQVKQRIADLEKAEASAREWIDKRDALMKSASDDVVAIYSKMEPENAARQIAAMDDRMAAAILGKLKPNAAGAILDEMDADRASRLAGLISG